MRVSRVTVGLLSVTVRIVVEKGVSPWDEMRRLSRSQTCAICQHSFEQNEIIWRVFIVLLQRRDWPWYGSLSRTGRVLASVCAECRDMARWPQSLPAERCRNCGRQYVMPYAFASAWRYGGCSRACQAEMRRQARNDRRRKQRAAARPQAICVNCGSSISGRRRGASYCSNACRQRAYRDRARDSRSLGTVLGPTS
jgi:hypothetical protein